MDPLIFGAYVGNRYYQVVASDLGEAQARIWQQVRTSGFAYRMQDMNPFRVIVKPWKAEPQVARRKRRSVLTLQP